MPAVVAGDVVEAVPETGDVDRFRAVIFRQKSPVRVASGTESCVMVQQRRVPTRTCVVCRERRQKDELLRIVRTPEGRVVYDRTGKQNGRGAYVCKDTDHWSEGAVRANRGKLKHALKTEIDEATMRSLNEIILRNHAE